MYRTITSLIICLAIAPFTYAQYGGQSYAPSAAKQANTSGAQTSAIPWVPPVPQVGAADYGRPQSTQRLLSLLLMYSGYYGPYYGAAENTSPSSGYGSSTYNATYGAGTAGNTQNPYGQNSAKQNTYTPAREPLATAAYPNHEPLLGGLADLKLSEVHVRRGDVVNARTWMRPKELSTLIESVNGNPQLYRNAERLTERLQTAGVLHAGDRAIGFADGKVYVLNAAAR